MEHLRSLWAKDRTAILAGLLNLSGLGVGFGYLRRWGALVVYWLGLVIWVVLASSTMLWLALLVIWWATAVVWVVIAGTEPRFRSRPPGRTWVPVSIGVGLLLVVTSQIVSYRESASTVLADGDDAHADGDCDEAVDRYDELTSSYKVSFTTAVDRAEAPRAACERLLRARSASEEDDYTTAIAHYQGYAEHGAAALFAEGADAELATVRAGYAEDLVSDDTDQGYEDAYEQYKVVVDEHPGSPEATAAPDDLMAMYETATSDYTDERYCMSIEDLELFVDFPDEDLAQPLRTRAQESLPDAVLGCGRQQFNQGDLEDAEETLQRVVDDFPDSSSVAPARQTLNRIPGAWLDRGRNHFSNGRLGQAQQALQRVIDDYPNSAAAAEARGVLQAVAQERERQRIQDTIDDLESGASELPPPTPSGTAPGGVATVEVINGSNVGLEILYDGPETGSFTLAACPDCSDVFGTAFTCGTASSPSRTVTVPAGTYRIAVRATDGGVVPFFGSSALASGTAYSDCYYIQTTFG